MFDDAGQVDKISTAHGGGTMTSHVILSSPVEFFRDALEDAMEKEHVSVSVFARHYVVRLLVRQVEQGYHPDETLSDRFALALASGPADRNRILAEVGDKALVFSGLWWEHQYRPHRPSHATFHIELGRHAYRTVGGVPFDELASNIGGVVDALIRLGTDHSMKTARDVLRMYLLWQETHSRHAARALLAQGVMIMPSPTQTPS